jgi:hypothetical protein
MSDREREAHFQAALEVAKAAPRVKGAVLLVISTDAKPRGYSVKMCSTLPASITRELVTRCAENLRGAESGLILVQ